MEVKINKEIRNYTESMFFGLSLRQFIFSLLAIGVAVGLYFLLRPHFGTETLSWMCILGAAPFAAMGFVRYNGMNAEQFVWAWFKSEFMMPKKLLFLPDNLYYGADLLGIATATLYDLLQKQPFQTVKVGMYTRIYIDSFEDWYKTQSHYKKVTEHKEVAECLKNELQN